jgi:single-strand DNA-binding protein
MFDTSITVVGNILSQPQWYRTHKTGANVLSFRIASTSRRYDRENSQWVDGDGLRVRVSCWRSLAENCGKSLQVGDAVVVHGRLYTRDWSDDQGNKRMSYELEATSVGHDLSRGTSVFARRKAETGTTMVDDGSDLLAAAGQLTYPIDGPDALDDELAGLRHGFGGDDESTDSEVDSEDSEQEPELAVAGAR